jgi:DNA-binding transcriptional MerR regulator
MSDVPTFSLSDLARQADVTPRTVRYYIGQGLLPGPVGQGPAAHYDPSHLDRLRLIKRLQLQHLPLAEIRARLEELDEGQIAALASEVDPDPAPEPQNPPGGSALDYIRGVLGGQSTGRQPPPMLSAFPAAAPRTFRAHQPVPEFAQAPPWLKPPPTRPREPGSERSTWERISLAPDIELHVRRPLAPQSIKQLDQLLDAARRLLRDE